jgi:hypothetical protein
MIPDITQTIKNALELILEKTGWIAKRTMVPVPLALIARPDTSRNGFLNNYPAK